jgi:hypothetical protein
MLNGVKGHIDLPVPGKPCVNPARSDDRRAVLKLNTGTCRRAGTGD